jgi:hypothetical protein
LGSVSDLLIHSLPGGVMVVKMREADEHHQSSSAQASPAHARATSLPIPATATSRADEHPTGAASTPVSPQPGRSDGGQDV